MSQNINQVNEEKDPNNEADAIIYNHGVEHGRAGKEPAHSHQAYLLGHEAGKNQRSSYPWLYDKEKPVSESVYKSWAQENRERMRQENLASKTPKVKGPSVNERKDRMYNELSWKIMDAVSNGYPDTDGTDSLYPAVEKLKRKHNINDSLYPHQHLDAACRKHLGCMNFYDYLDQVDQDYKGSNPEAEYHGQVKEEVNVVGGGAIAGVGVGAQGEPGVNSKYKAINVLMGIMSRKKLNVVK